MKKITPLFLILFVSCISLKAENYLQQYVAKYKLINGNALTQVYIEIKSNHLQLISAMGNGVIDKIENDKFIIPQLNIVGYFIRSKSNQITGIYIDKLGTKYQGNKIEETDNFILPISAFPIKFLPTNLK